MESLDFYLYLLCRGSDLRCLLWSRNDGNRVHAHGNMLVPLDIQLHGLMDTCLWVGTGRYLDLFTREG
jgi:hypothetical protein